MRCAPTCGIAIQRMNCAHLQPPPSCFLFALSPPTNRLGMRGVVLSPTRGHLGKQGTKASGERGQVKVMLLLE